MVKITFYWYNEFMQALLPEDDKFCVNWSEPEAIDCYGYVFWGYYFIHKR